MHPMSFSIDYKYVASLKEMAKDMDVTPSAIIREIITAYLEERAVSIDKIQGQYLPRPSS